MRHFFLTGWAVLDSELNLSKSLFQDVLFFIVEYTFYDL